MQYGGFWIRVVAALIDELIIIGLISFLPSYHVPLMVVAEWLYFSLMQSSSLQATVGKYILNMKVTDTKKRRINFATATIRYFSKFLSAAILMIGFLMIAFTKKKQGLHDILAGTLVLRS